MDFPYGTCLIQTAISMQKLAVIKELIFEMIPALRFDRISISLF